MITSSPLRAIAHRNQPQSLQRDMRDKIPYLYPEFVAGPFRLFALAADYADQLVVGRRGLPSKVRHGCALALAFHVPCYHIARPPPLGFAAYLASLNAPPSYTKACARIAAACRDLSAYASSAKADTAAPVGDTRRKSRVLRGKALVAPQPDADDVTTAVAVCLFAPRPTQRQVVDGSTLAVLARAWPPDEEPLGDVLQRVQVFWKDARLQRVVAEGATDMDSRGAQLLLARDGLLATRDRVARIAKDPDAPPWLQRVSSYLKRQPAKLRALVALTEMLDRCIDQLLPS